MLILIFGVFQMALQAQKNPKKYYVNPRTTEFVNLPVTLTATKDGKSSTKTKTIVGWWD